MKNDKTLSACAYYVHRCEIYTACHQVNSTGRITKFQDVFRWKKWLESTKRKLL